MALEWTTINVPVDGIDRTQSRTDAGDRNIQNGVFIRQGEIAPAVTWQAVNVPTPEAPVDANDGGRFRKAFSVRDQVWQASECFTYSGASTNYPTFIQNTASALTSSTGVITTFNADHIATRESYSSNDTYVSMSSCCDSYLGIFFTVNVEDNVVSGTNLIRASIYSDDLRLIDTAIVDEVNDTYYKLDINHMFISPRLSMPVRVATVTSTGNLSAENGQLCVYYCDSLTSTSYEVKIRRLSYRRDINDINNCKFFGVGSVDVLTATRSASYPLPCFDVTQTQIKNGVNRLDATVFIVAGSATGVRVSAAAGGFPTGLPIANIAYPAGVVLQNPDQMTISSYYCIANSTLYVFWTGTRVSTTSPVVCESRLTFDVVSGFLTSVTSPRILFSSTVQYIYNICPGPGAASEYAVGLIVCVRPAGQLVQNCVFTNFHAEYILGGTPAFSSLFSPDLNNVMITSDSFPGNNRDENLSEIIDVFDLYKSTSGRNWYGAYFEPNGNFSECVVSLDFSSFGIAIGDIIDDVNEYIVGAELTVTSVLGYGRTFSYSHSKVAQNGNKIFRASFKQIDLYTLPLSNLRYTFCPRISTTLGSRCLTPAASNGTTYINAGMLYEISSATLYPAQILPIPAVYSFEFDNTPPGSIPHSTALDFRFCYATKLGASQLTYGTPTNEGEIFTAPSSGADYKLFLTFYAPPRQNFTNKPLYLLIYYRFPATDEYGLISTTLVDFNVNYKLAPIEITMPGSSPSAFDSELYTATQEIPNVITPACNFLVNAFDDRVVTLDDFDNVFISKPINSLRTLEFSDLLVSRPPSISERIQGCASLDASLIAISYEASYSASGFAPDSFGNGSVPPFVKNQSSLGCAKNAYALSAKTGIYYVTDGGVALLDRSLSSSLVGLPIQDSFDSGDSYYPQQGIFSSSSYFPKLSLVMFARGDTIFGYHESYGKWVSFKADTSPALIPEIKSISSTANSVYVCTGTALYALNTYSGSATISPTLGMTYDTGWISPFGGNQYGRIRRVSALFSNAGANTTLIPADPNPSITFDYYFDYNDLPNQESLSFTGTQFLAMIGGVPWGSAATLIHVPKTQQMRAIRIVMKVYPPTQLTFRGFAMEVGAKSGLVKVKTSNVI